MLAFENLDKLLEKRGHRYVRYADDFSIYLFLKNRLKLPSNRAKSGIRRPTSFKILGHGFVPTYRKGEKGKYQFVVKQKSWEIFKQKLKRLTRKTLPLSFDQRIQGIKQLMKG